MGTPSWREQQSVTSTSVEEAMILLKARATSIEERESLLLDYLQSTEQSVQLYCIQTLGFLGSKKAVPVLASFLTHQDVELVRATVTALGRIQCKKARMLLHKLMNEVDHDLRLFISAALAT